MLLKNKIIIIFIYNIFSFCFSWYNPTLSQKRDNLAATTINNLAIFAGGCFSINSFGLCNNNGYSSQVDIYNYTSNTWYTATLSQARNNLAGTSVNNLAIFGGGYNNNGSTNQVDIYNYTSNLWYTTTLSIARAFLMATTIKDLAIFAGGGKNYTFAYDYVDIYNYSSNSWYTTTLSQARSELSATTVNELAMFAGGLMSLSGPFYSNVDVYNYSSNSWYTTTLSQARGILAATTIENLAFFAGGYGNLNDGLQGPFSLIDIYNYLTNSWYTATLSVPRCLLVATTIKNLVFFAGGLGTFAGPFYNQVDIFNYKNNLWSTATLSQARCALISTTIGNYSFFAGGENINLEITFSQIDIYNYSSNSWIPECPANTYLNYSGSFIHCIPCPQGQISSPGSYNCYQKNNYLIIEIVIPIIFSILILIILIIIFLYKKQKRKNKYYFQSDSIKIEGVKFIENIEIKEKLGGGNFGEVYKGIWNGTTEVALKKLKSKEDLKQFIQEVNLLKSLNHPNIVQFFGIYNSSFDEKYIVMEYLSKGSLDNVLHIEKDLLKMEDLLIFSKHTVAGMQYLEENKIIHRDLALRNLLVAPGNDYEKYIIKISDFGLSKPIEKDYYKTDDTTMPVRWSAPEVLEKGIYSSKSDVWSFGIVLWEIFTFGNIPYIGMSNVEVAKQVLSGYRLEKPENCPNEIYELMLQCWNEKSLKRPTFKELYDTIYSFLGSDYKLPKKKESFISPISNKQNYVFSDNDIHYKE